MSHGSEALSLAPARMSARGSTMPETAICCWAGAAVLDGKPSPGGRLDGPEESEGCAAEVMDRRRLRSRSLRSLHNWENRNAAAALAALGPLGPDLLEVDGPLHYQRLERRVRQRIGKSPARAAGCKGIERGWRVARRGGRDARRTIGGQPVVDPELDVEMVEV